MKRSLYALLYSLLAMPVAAAPANLADCHCGEASLDEPPLAHRDIKGLSLIAIFFSDSESSIAVFNSPSVNYFFLEEGGWVGDGLMLKCIKPRSVYVCENDTRLIYMGLPAYVSDRGEVQSDGENGLTGQDEKPSVEIDQDLNKVRESFLKVFNVSIESDSAMGYRYVIGGPIRRSIYEMTKVKPGDILYSINGYRLGEATEEELAWMTLVSSGVGRVQVARGRDKFEFVFNY